MRLLIVDILGPCPATDALADRGYRFLDDIANTPPSEVAMILGVGPKVLKKLILAFDILPELWRTGLCKDPSLLVTQISALQVRRKIVVETLQAIDSQEAALTRELQSAISEQNRISAMRQGQQKN